MQQQGQIQDELAEAAGIHDKHVGVIERGTHGITLEYLCKIASRSGRKSVFLLEAKVGKNKKNGINILTKKI